ncbi:MAG: hypothetical protein ACD_72C00093G0001, partial [uncultured bacterium]
GLRDAEAAKTDQPKPKELAIYNPTQTPWGDVTDEWNQEGQNAIEAGWITKEGLLLFAGQEELDRRLRVIKDIDLVERQAKMDEVKKREQSLEQKELNKKRQELLELLKVLFVVQQLPDNIIKITKLQNNMYMLVTYDPTNKERFFNKKGGDPTEILNETIRHIKTLLEN